jgi:orotate phosphoribosyltransferase
VQQSYGIPVVAVATLRDLIAFLQGNTELERNLEAVIRYREQYGIQEG